MRAHEGWLRVWGTLPDRYNGRQIAASTIDADGRIVALLVDPDVECAQRGGNNATYDATLVLNDGSEYHKTVGRNLNLRFPKVDVLEDGFVLTATRCRMPPRPQGKPYETFEESDVDLARNALVVDAAGPVNLEITVPRGGRHEGRRRQQGGARSLSICFGEGSG
jgi:hypothetical protein